MKYGIKQLDEKILVIIATTIVTTIIGITIFITLKEDSSPARVIYTADNSELQSTTDRLNKFFESQDTSTNPATVAKDARKSIHDRKIIETYANDRSLSVSTSQVESYYEQRVARYNSEADLLNEINRLYGISKQEYLQQIQYDLLREKVQSQLDEPLGEWLTKQRSNSTLEIN